MCGVTGIGPGWDCGRCRLDGLNGLLLHCRDSTILFYAPSLPTEELPNLHIFGLWEEIGASGGNSHGHGEKVQTPHRH